MIRKTKTNSAFSTALNLVPIALVTAAALDPVTDALEHNYGSIFAVMNSALPRWKSKKRS